MKRGGRATASGRGPGRRRRRGLKRILFGTPAEHTQDYPGYFVLLRASSATHTTPGKHPTRRVWSARCKLTAMLLLVLGGFVGTLAYFFSQVAPEMAEPAPPAAPFISDPKMLPTNSDAGLGRR